MTVRILGGIAPGRQMSSEARLPRRSSSRYLDRMRTAFAILSLLLSTVFCLLAAPAAVLPAEQPDAGLEAAPIEDYSIYDRVVLDKFLTSQTELVLIERLTVTRLGPDWPPTSLAFFEENGFFEGRLPRDLVRDFIVKNRRPSRLEARFNFGVRYQFISEEGLEPEVSLAPVPAAFLFPAPQSLLTQSAPPTVGLLGFSRAGFTVNGDQALVYVGDNREDGTGAGFLLWLSRRGRDWEIADTDVLWIARPE